MQPLLVGTAVVQPVAVRDLHGFRVRLDHVSGFVLDLAGASNRLAAGFVLLMILAPGFFSEVIALMVIFVPILAPLGAPLGFDPIHWGLLLAMATNVGGITPPVGAHLFSSLRRASPSAASAR